MIPTIGLEIHIELTTKTKMFCGCLNDPEERIPNVNVCPVCLGHPGTLPTPNREAIRSVIQAGLAIGGKIAEKSHFDRKSYFYPDLPKGYQISQYDEPFVSEGILESVRITRIHLEEDAGRLSHVIDGREDPEWSYVDFNRAGVPLMELVTEPDIRNGEEAVRFARALQRLMRYLGASSADMELGQMRVEVNISLRKNENDPLGTKVEVKNINSFKAVQGAIDYEITRQTEILESGGTVIHETRGWNEKTQTTESQRSKEMANDYRYFPEPDIPPMTFSKTDIEEIMQALPELPEQKRVRFLREYTIPESQLDLILDDPAYADYFEEACSELGSLESDPDYALAGNYFVSDIWGLLAKHQVKFSELKVRPGHFARLISLIQEGKCSSRIAKDVLLKMFQKGDDPEEIMKSEHITLVADDSALLPVIREIIEKNEKAVSEYKAGKVNALQLLVGQGMAKTRGQADPNKLRELFTQQLS